MEILPYIKKQLLVSFVLALAVISGCAADTNSETTTTNNETTTTNDTNEISSTIQIEASTTEVDSSASESVKKPVNMFYSTGVFYRASYGDDGEIYPIIIIDDNGKAQLYMLETDINADVNFDSLSNGTKISIGYEFIVELMPPKIPVWEYEINEGVHIDEYDINGIIENYNLTIRE